MKKNVSPEIATQTLIDFGLHPHVDAYTQTLFLRCAKDGNLEAVRAYLALGMPVDARDENNQGTALIRAAEGDHPTILRALAKAGADLEARDEDDDTALMTAINWEHAKALRTLIKLGANVNSLSKRNGTPLMSALDKDQLRMFNALIKAGADVNQTFGTQGYVALHKAVQENKTRYAEALIAAGADVNVRYGKRKRTPLALAALKGHSALIPILVKAGADTETPDAFGWTAWQLASYSDHSGTVTALEAAGGTPRPTPDHDLLKAALAGDVDGLRSALNAGAHLDALDPDGDTVLALACFKGHADATQVLIKAGAGLEPRTPGAWSPLMYAASAECLECVSLLLDAGAKPTHGENWSPLSRAAQRNRPDIVQMLMDAGADLDAGDSYRQTALLWAVAKDNLAMFDKLIEEGANPNCRANKGSTPLHIAVKDHKPLMVTRLIEAGADLDIPNSMGETALHNACFAGDTELAIQLLEAGADPAWPNNLGHQPLTQARMMHKTACVEAVVDFLTMQAYRETRQELGIGENQALPETFYTRLAARRPASALIEWVRQGDTNVVAGLLSAGVSPEVRDGYGETPLVIAAQEGHLDIAHLLLDAGADVAATTRIGSTALHKAGYKGHLDIVAALLTAKANPNQGDDWQHTPVHSAAGGGQVEVLALLHHAGGTLDPNPVGDSPLMRAARSQQTPAMRWLIEAGAALDIRNDKLDTALSLAVQKRNYVNTWHVLNAGADPNPVGQEGRTPLMQAAEAGELEIVSLLLHFGADATLTDAQGHSALDLAAYREDIATILSEATGVERPTLPLRPADMPPQPPLHHAAHRGDLEEVQRLLAEGVAVDARNRRGDTALMLAAERGHTTIVQALLEAGSDVHAENDAGENAWVMASTLKQDEAEALLKAAGASVDVNKMAEHMMRLEEFSKALRDGSIAKIRELVESGKVDIDGLTAGRQSALIIAVYHNDEPLTRLLLAAGADPDIPNRDAHTPLMIAARFNHERLLTLLLEAGVEATCATPDGVTALLLAVGENHPGNVQHLLEAGADPNQCDQNGITPLMQAVAATQPGEEAITVHLLIKAGADLHARDGMGDSAVDWAHYFKNSELVTYLRALGGPLPRKSNKGER